jgi:hypothetical protein
MHRYSASEHIIIFPVPTAEMTTEHRVTTLENTKFDYYPVEAQDLITEELSVAVTPVTGTFAVGDYVYYGVSWNTATYRGVVVSSLNAGTELNLYTIDGTLSNGESLYLKDGATDADVDVVTAMTRTCDPANTDDVAGTQIGLFGDLTFEDVLNGALTWDDDMTWFRRNTHEAYVVRVTPSP